MSQKALESRGLCLNCYAIWTPDTCLQSKLLGLKGFIQLAVSKPVQAFGRAHEQEWQS